MELRVNDLFCGAGGMGLGFKQAGFRLGGAWDFDKWAVESYGNNVSPKVKQADITQMEWNELPYADVWTFGFPCQDLSVAGKQAGMVKGQTRSGLFYEVMRLLEETEANQPERLPKIIMAENVKGLKKYLPELEKEYNARGYKMYYTLYNSKYWGVPQNRERYFVVGVRKELDKPFGFPIQQEDYVPKLSSILEDDVDEKFYVAEDKAKNVIEQAISKGRINQLEANDPQKIGGMFDSEKSKHQAGSCWNKNAPSPTLDTAQGGYRQPLVTVKVKNQANEIVGETEVSGTLLARDYKGFGNQEMDAVIVASRGRYNEKGEVEQNYELRKDNVTNTLTSVQKDNLLYENLRIRKLTPREYARLQGFPESFEFHVSNSQLYKQFGNAVTVNVAKAIAERIKTYLEK